MILFPAIDILDGRAVRLLYGKKDNVTDYGLPLDRAKEWVDSGAGYLHVVDLSGAFSGKSGINNIIEKIAALGVPVQSGGGLRTYSDVKDRLESGAARVVLGTLCYSDPEFFSRLADDFKEKIVAGIDAKDGFVMINGWTKSTGEKAEDFGKRVKNMGLTTCVYTDISRDGALKGAAVSSTAALQKSTDLNVIASGGISSINDLLSLKENGVYGAILGRSIYTGAINLKKAIEETK